MQIKFDGKVILRDWVTDKVIAEYPEERGLWLGGHSKRFDGEHCTAAVRCLDELYTAVVNADVEILEQQDSVLQIKVGQALTFEVVEATAEDRQHWAEISDKV